MGASVRVSGWLAFNCAILFCSIRDEWHKQFVCPGSHVLGKVDALGCFLVIFLLQLVQVKPLMCASVILVCTAIPAATSIYEVAAAEALALIIEGWQPLSVIISSRSASQYLSLIVYKLVYFTGWAATAGGTDTCEVSVVGSCYIGTALVCKTDNRGADRSLHICSDLPCHCSNMLPSEMMRIARPTELLHPETMLAY